MTGAGRSGSEASPATPVAIPSNTPKDDGPDAGSVSTAETGPDVGRAAAPSGAPGADAGATGGAKSRWGAIVGRLTGWRAAIRRRPVVYAFYRALVGVVGGSIMVGGLLLIPLPGPGWVIIFFGLAVLATEFTWAARLQGYARKQVAAWSQWVGSRSPALRVLLAVLTVVLLLALVYGLFVISGVPGWIPAGWVPDLPGL